MRNNNDNSDIFSLGGLLLVVVLSVAVLFIASLESDNATIQINKKVESIGGTIITIDKIDLFEDTPFILSKGDVAYKFVYKVQGVEKTGWLKDGFSYDWILDYQK